MIGTALAALALAQPAATPAWWSNDRYGQSVAQGIPGVFMFRGNPGRNFVGVGPMPTGNVQVLWRYRIGTLPGGHWNGIGWTGQPLIVTWPDPARRFMNFTKQPGPTRELIVGALDGQVHFVDAATGKASRKPIDMPANYPIKGTITLDPRGWPLLYVGIGLDKGRPAYRIFSLLDGKMLYEIPTKEGSLARRWPAADSNAVILRDHLFLPGENGMFYKVRLNASWNQDTGKLALNPERQTVKVTSAGMEGSLAVLGNVGIVGANDGGMWKFNLDDPSKPTKLFSMGDDTDSTPVVDVRGSMYVGSEVDKTARKGGKGRYVKFDPQTGSKLWEYTFQAGSIAASAKQPNAINGGVLSTGALCDETGSILISTAHNPRIGQGRLVSLDRNTGNERWAIKLRGFAWSSPIAVGGVAFVADSSGAAYVVDTRNGRSLLTDGQGRSKPYLELGGNAEGSPIVWNGRIYIGIRGGALLCLGRSRARTVQ